MNARHLQLLLILWLVLAAVACSAWSALAGHPCAQQIHHHRQLQSLGYHGQQLRFIQPHLYYQVGQEMQIEAAVQKALRDDPDYQEFRAFQAYKQGLRQQTPSPVPTGALGLQGDLLRERCASCHDAETGRDPDARQAWPFPAGEWTELDAMRAGVAFRLGGMAAKSGATSDPKTVKAISDALDRELARFLNDGGDP